MSKNQELSEQLQDEKLEAIGGRGLDNQVKNLSLRGKVARWAAVAATAGGISLGMAIPAQAINRTRCNSLEFFQIVQKDSALICFANAGITDLLVIADVRKVHPGNNAGTVYTNKGSFRFNKYSSIDFLPIGTVTIYSIFIE